MRQLAVRFQPFGRIVARCFSLIVSIGKRIFAHPVISGTSFFLKKYSTQLSFTVIIIGFLTVSVGEGQAYDVGPAINATQARAQSDGFIGKPEVFVGQTVLTGEVQQSVAIVYQVEKGDTMLGIANRYNLSVGSILDANNISATQAEKIQPGSELLIPAEDSNQSLAWLDQINSAKEAERQKALKEEQKRLTAQLKAKNKTSGLLNNLGNRLASSAYGIVGTFRLPYNGGVPGQCTNWVLYKRPDLPRRMGNGGQYLASARGYGLPTGRNPRPGAIMVSSESWYGHVGYVESVHGDSFTITDMNYAAPYVVTRREISINSPVVRGFVY